MKQIYDQLQENIITNHCFSYWFVFLRWFDFYFIKKKWKTADKQLNGFMVHSYSCEDEFMISCCPVFCSSIFVVFWLWVYLMKGISETRGMFELVIYALLLSTYNKMVNLLVLYLLRKSYNYINPCRRFLIQYSNLFSVQTTNIHRIKGTIHLDWHLNIY
jgi:hypothetical protein